jgi:hypothetical protein
MWGRIGRKQKTRPTIAHLEIATWGSCWPHKAVEFLLNDQRMPTIEISFITEKCPRAA